MGALSFLTIFTYVFLFLSSGIEAKISRKDWLKNAPSQPHSALILKLFNQTALVYYRDRDLQKVGTAFFVGRLKGKPLFLTNEHVLNKVNCSLSQIHFFDRQGFRQSAYCEKIYFSYGESTESDVTLFSLSERWSHMLPQDLLELDFHYSPHPGDQLAQVGFGQKIRLPSGLETRERFYLKLPMQLETGEDCVLSSAAGRLFKTLMPKEREGRDYIVDFAFATGCSIRSGDSGSAVLNLNTGKIIGLFYSGVTINQVSRDVWKQWVGTQHPGVWQRGSFAFSLQRLKEDWDELKID
jgi:hypothetical protein